MGPLHGLRVVELASIGPGPMCAMLLADLGADVIRVDRLEPSGLGVPTTPRFDVSARSRRSVALDLKAPAARDAALALADRADVLLEGWRPGVTERLGLGPDVCLARNPRLVYGRVTGFGQSGPLARTAGHDLTYIALTGALHAIGPAEAPVPPLNLIGDFGGGGMLLAVGVLAALQERTRSGRGQVVDAAMVDGASMLMGMFHGLQAAGQWDETARAANLLDGGAPYYGTYATADGRFVAVAPLEAKFFAEFAARIGLPHELAAARDDRARWPALRAAIADRLRTRTRDEWAALFAGTDACVAPVLTLDEAPRHPHAVARTAYVEVDGVVQPAPAPRFSRSTPEAPRPPAAPGADTAAVLREAGLGAEAIAALLESGAARP